MHARAETSPAPKPFLALVLLAWLSFLLLAAHALRAGQTGLALSLAFLPALLLTRQAWTRIALSILLFAGSLLWADVATDLIRFRMVVGAPWVRLAAIMGGIFCLTLVSGCLLAGKKGGVHFTRNQNQAIPLAILFLLLVLLLALVLLLPEQPLLLLDRYFPGFGWIEVFLLGCYGAWVGQKMLSPASAAGTRSRIWAFFSFVFFLQLLLGLLGLERMLMTGQLHLPVPALILAGPLYRGEGFFMVILFLVTIALVGPAWCSHLCYIGAWDDRMSRVRKKPRSLPSWTKPVRWGLLFLVAATALVLRFLEVPAGAAVWTAALFGILGLVIMVLASTRNGSMVHCTVYCPIGLIGNLFGKLHPWKVRIGADCTGCGKCSQQCRYAALQPVDLRSGRPGFSCTLCGDCIAACPHRLIGYSFPGLSPSRARELFVGLIVVLHTLFLAAARI